MKKYLVLIPGMLSDQRLFSQLEFKEYEVIHLKYDHLFFLNSIQDISLELSKKLPKEGDFFIIGSSLGAVIALELSEIIRCQKILLIAGIKSRKELPLLLKLAYSLKIINILPDVFFSFIKKNQCKSAVDLSIEMASNKTNIYIKASLKLLAKWQPSAKQNNLNLCHIHGTSDTVFPLKLVSPNYKIKGAGHYLCLTHSKEIQKILDLELFNS